MPSTDPRLYHFPPQPHPLPSTSSPIPLGPRTPTFNIIDLTGSPPPSLGPGAPAPMPPKRGSSATQASVGEAPGDEGPPAKRRRRVGGIELSQPPVVSDDVPIIDLEDDNPVGALLQKQREEQIRAQQATENEGPQKLSNLSCIICMELPTDLSITSCGHLFCHECLLQALHASESRAVSNGEARRSQCPVCRKKIGKTKKGDVIPMLMMKKSKWKGKHK